MYSLLSGDIFGFTILSLVHIMGIFMEWAISFLFQMMVYVASALTILIPSIVNWTP